MISIRASLLTCLFLASRCLPASAGLVPAGMARNAAERFIADHAATAPGCRLNGQVFSFPADNTPCYRILNLEPSGFIIIAADDAVFPVLGYSFRDAFDPAREHPAFSSWMTGYAAQISRVRALGLEADAATREAWRNLAGPSREAEKQVLSGMAPLLTTTWDQDFPFNALCPADINSGGSYSGHVPAGCTAVAMAQLMYYWRFPATGAGSHCISPPLPQYGPQCADFGASSYGWTGMVNQPEKACDPAATLCYQAGVAVDMQYGTNSSVSLLDHVPAAMKNFFRYDPDITSAYRNNYSTSDWMQLLRYNLDSRWPLVYFAGSAVGAHIFICDGYQNNDFFHFNWGWGGLYDGYYYLNNLNPGGIPYNGEQGAVFYIHPPPTSYPPFCSGLQTLEWPDRGSIEDGSGPVLNYQNMSDCRWLIKPADSIDGITLHFIRFNVGAADMVRVYDGADPGSPLLGSFSGNSLPPDITSSGKQMLVRLTSMLSSTSQGFLAEYAATPHPYCDPDTILQAPSGNISDGSGPFDYRNDTQCLWFISPAGANTVTLSFSDFDTEQDLDVVNVFSPGSSVPLASYSGKYTTPPPPVTSPAGSMVVQFTSSRTTRGKGWSATYSSPVGMNEPHVAGHISVIPNPVASEASVTVPGLQPGQETKAVLIDVSGRIVREEKVLSSPWIFRRGSLQPGVYLLMITGNGGFPAYPARVIITGKEF